MKKILAVNIDSLTLNIISSLLTEHTSDFEILTTERHGEIDEIIKKLSPDLVIIDLEKPSPGDLQILGYLAKNYIKIPLMVMTAFETGEIESTIKSISSIRYFEKPVDFKEVADAIFEAIEIGVGGEIHGISLTSFLQMSEMEKTSCTLKIKTAEKTGYLHLLKGALIAAETETLSKEEAVYDILSWENPVIEIEETRTQKKREIQTPLMNLMMEGVRRKDEKLHGEKAGKKATVKKAKKISIRSADISTADDTATEEEAGEKEKPGKKPSRKKPEKAPDTSTAEPPEALTASGKITDASEVLKKKRLLALTVKIAAVLVVILTLFFLWQLMAEPWLAERSFHQTMTDVGQAPTIGQKVSILEDYLNTDPATTYAAQAENLLLSLRINAEKRDFDQAVERVSSLDIDQEFQTKAEEIYKAFLGDYPDSKYKEKINRRIEELPDIIEDEAYRKLLEIPANQFSQRIAAYKQYLQQYPDGANTDKVEERFTSLGEDFYQHINTMSKKCDQDRQWQPCINLCRYYLDNFDQHPRREATADLLQRMEDRVDLAELTRQAEEKGPYSTETRQLYADYLEKKPRTTIKPRLEDEIRKIDRFQEEENRWINLRNYAGNSSNNIFQRIERLQRYIDEGPPARFQQEARVLMARLEGEKNIALKESEIQAEQERQGQQKQAAIERVKTQIRQRMVETGDRYQEKRSETITDTQTRLTWTMLDSSVLTDQCIDYHAARDFVEGLTTGGLNDWRLPTPTELLVIYNSNPPFPAGDRSWYWTSEVFSAAWQEKVNTVRRSDDGVWRKSETRLHKCGTVRAVRP